MNSQTQRKTINVIDLFSGCGGLSEGLMQVGDQRTFLPKGLQKQRFWDKKVPKNTYNILAHVEWEAPMVRTLRANLHERWKHNKTESKRRVVHFDIQETDALLKGCSENENLKERFPDNHDDFLKLGLDGLVGERSVDMIVGGPPCQAYSLASRAQDKHGMRHDYRNFLFESFAKVVEHYQPQLFVFENVEGLLSAKPSGQKATELIYQHFLSIGYLILMSNEIHKALIDLSQYGVPQKRKRIIIIGLKISNLKPSKQDLDLIYEKLLSLPNHKTLNRVFTFKDAVGHLETASDNHQDPLHRPRFHNERDKALFYDWITQGYNEKSTKERLDFYNKRMNKSSNHIKYRSLVMDKPSPTIVAHLYKDGLMFIHPDANQRRSITAREAALLQSFPPDYLFPESQGATYKMIGNAVPPLFARRLGEVIYDLIKG
jgi:DNA (cytosine-5)-methyltransferase 1